MKETVFTIADKLTKKGERFAFVTNTNVSGSSPGIVGAMMIVNKNGIVAGTIGGGKLESQVIEESMECIKKKISKTYDFNLTDKGNGMACGGQVTGYINLIDIPTVYIIGAGHIGYAIYNILKTLSFRVVVIDNRSEFCNKDRFPEADEVICEEIDVATKKLETNENSYVAIVSRGHAEDKKAILGLENKNVAYIGLIGSRRKLKVLEKEFIEEGRNSIMNDIYAPIGLDISDGTVEEIAIGIVSEILMIKNKGKLAHRKDL